MAKRRGRKPTKLNHATATQPYEPNEPAEAALLKPRSANSDNNIESLYYGTVEQTFQDSSYVPDTYKKPYNPDDLWQKKGSYEIYQEMMQDDQVSICMQLKKDLVVGCGGEFVSDDDGQEEIVDDLWEAFYIDPRYSFDDMIEEMLTAYEFGFSLSEKVFKDRGDGTIGLDCILNRHPDSWLIHQDDKGNITQFEQRTAKSNITVDPKSLLHLLTKRRFQNPYGKSDLRDAYNAWFTKRHVCRMYSIFLEKAASPTPVGRYDKGVKQESIDALFAAIKNLQTKTAMVLPKEVEMEFLEAKNNGEAFVKGINIFNMFIGRALFVPDLLGFQGSETTGGAYSLGVEHMKLFYKHIERRKNAIENVVNEGIVKPIVIYNHGIQESYPRWKLTSISQDQAIDLAKLWIEAVKGKFYKPSDEEINKFRNIVQMPEGDVERDDSADMMKQQLLQQGRQNGGGPNPQPGQKVPDDESEPEPAKYKVYLQPKDKYYRKVNFKLLESQLNQGTNMVLVRSKPIIKSIVEEMFAQIKDKNILRSGDVSSLDKISLAGFAELNEVLDQYLEEHYQENVQIAQAEIDKKDFANKKPIVSDEFLQVLSQENYQAIGKWEYDFKDGTKTRIINAIKDGRPISEVVQLVDEEIVPNLNTSVERYARTKFTEVMNKGRLEAFNANRSVEAYQYSAILDDRTTDICAGLHGAIFEKGTEPVPPLHFNCRSLLVPITKYEEWSPTESIGDQDVQDFIDDNKGKGFATK